MQHRGCHGRIEGMGENTSATNGGNTNVSNLQTEHSVPLGGAPHVLVLRPLRSTHHTPHPTCLDLDEGGVVVRVPEATLETKHDALHVQPYGLEAREGGQARCGRGREGGGGDTQLLVLCSRSDGQVTRLLLHRHT